MEKDIRIRILEHFQDLNKSTEETKANKWLSDIHSDLGTIRRGLIELIRFDHLSISEKEKDEAICWLKKEWDTTTNNIPQTRDDKDKKSSKRLIEDVGNHAKVKEVRLITTVHGIRFLEEYSRFRREHFYRIGYLILGVFLTLLATIIQDLLN
ncbi:hypothetical protein [Gracilimonas sediminicola]|uniref:hypothetical protein n=1 Tax=Gracilimonas sediminicola TaxID=2952158 RepID=UPI0038D516E1